MARRAVGGGSPDVARLRAMFEEARDQSAQARLEALTDIDYYDSQQWTAEERAALRERRQPDIVINRIQMSSAGGVLIQDVDPVAFGQPGEASVAEVNAGLASGKYVSPAGLAGWTGVAGALGYTPLNRAGDTASGLNLSPAAAPAVNAAGFLGLPVVTLNANANLGASHNGRMVRHTDATAYTWTIPPASTAGWVLSTAIALRNAGAGAITLARGAGVALRRGGGATDAAVTLAQWGFAFLTMEDMDVWIVQGSGLA